MEKPIKDTLVLKFAIGQPSLDNIQLHMVKRWGLANISTIGIFDKRNIMVLMLKIELDFEKAWNRESRDMDGFNFRVFKLFPYFNGREEPPLALVWVNFPSRPLHFF